MPKNHKKETCENCHYFDNSAHKLDARTAHAGVCKKFSEIVFLSDNCSQYFDVSNLPQDKIFQPQETYQQRTLF